MIDEDAIRYRWETVGSKLDERGRRLFAAGEVRSAGWGGLAIVSRITGLARSTINRGEDDLDGGSLSQGQASRSGAGRKSVSERDPGLAPALRRLVEPAMLGSPVRARDAVAGKAGPAEATAAAAPETPAPERIGPPTCIEAMREKIKAGGHACPYRLRKQLPEPAFGQIKQARGSRQPCVCRCVCCLCDCRWTGHLRVPITTRASGGPSPTDSRPGSSVGRACD